MMQKVYDWPIQFSSVTQSCPTLCHPMDYSTPGLPVHDQLPEFTQTHVHWVGDAIQPSHWLIKLLLLQIPHTGNHVTGFRHWGVVLFLYEHCKDTLLNLCSHFVCIPWLWSHFKGSDSMFSKQHSSSGTEKLYVFIYCWLCWVFVAAWALWGAGATL